MIKNYLFSICFLFTCIVSTSQTTVKLKQQDGIYLVPCKINGLDFELFFDTGASLVSLSLKEAKQLVAAGKLKQSDIVGKTQMSIANGQIVNGTIVLLREIKVGDLVLKNIDAVITETQNAPLLLGQSAIKEFGEFTFDSKTGLLKINKYAATPVAYVLYDEHKKGLTPAQLKEFTDFYKYKADILNAMQLDLVRYKTYQLSGDTHISLTFDITNNSDYNYSLM
jgi:aspartyl protease family protein